MTLKMKTVSGYLRNIQGDEIITEVSVHLSLISPLDLFGPPRIKGILIIQSFKPEYNDKQYILELTQEIKGKVRITMQPMSGRDMDLINTQYDIWFEDSFWGFSTKWFESL